MTIHKVTAFITRRQQAKQQLLLFRHPIAGVQIPAGTVDEGESWETAVLREAQEETGLTQLTIHRYLGKIENELAPNEAVISRDCHILSQPDAESMPFERPFTRGVTVQVGEMATTSSGSFDVAQGKRFCQISYTEYDQYPNPQMITLQIIGWLPQDHLSQSKTRHYVHLRCHENTPDHWTLLSDNDYRFAPFWADLTPKPAIIPPQNGWLDDVYEALIRP